MYIYMLVTKILLNHTFFKKIKIMILDSHRFFFPAYILLTSVCSTISMKALNIHFKKLVTMITGNQ